MWFLLGFVAVALLLVVVYTNAMDAMFAAEAKKREEVVGEAANLQKSITTKFNDLQETGVEMVGMAEKLDDEEQKQQKAKADKIPS